MNLKKLSLEYLREIIEPEIRTAYRLGNYGLMTDLIEKYRALENELR